MEKFPANSLDQVKLCLLLARARTEGRARGEGAGAHAEAGAERRRDVAEEIAAAGAVAVVGSGNCDIGAHPLAARFAERIDALHGETGQVLHLDSLRGRKAQVKIFATTEHPREKFAEPPGGASRCKSPAKKNLNTSWPGDTREQCKRRAEFCREKAVVSREKDTRYWGSVAVVLWTGFMECLRNSFRRSGRPV
jgi:hypothetical protein